MFRIAYILEIILLFRFFKEKEANEVDAIIHLTYEEVMILSSYEDDEMKKAVHRFFEANWFLLSKKESKNYNDNLDKFHGIIRDAMGSVSNKVNGSAVWTPRYDIYDLAYIGFEPLSENVGFNKSIKYEIFPIYTHEIESLMQVEPTFGIDL